MIKTSQMVGEMQTELLDNLSREGMVNSVTLDLTENCNCNCIFCFKESSKKKEKELSTLEIKILLVKLREAGCYVVQFSGGEIFTRNDTLEIIRYAKKLRFYVCVNTNATILNNEIIHTLKDLFIDKIICSFHSLNERVFKKIVNSNVSFDLTLSNILELQKVGLPVEVNMILTKYNISEVKDLKYFFNNKGIFVITDLPNTSCYSDNVMNLYPDHNQIKKYVRENHPKSNDQVKKDRTLCGIGRNGFVILSNGDVLPCHSYGEIIGNINEFEDLKDIMKLPIMLQLKNKTIQDLPICSECEDNIYCNICIGENFIEHSTIFKPSASTCKIASIVSSYNIDLINNEGKL